MVANLKNCALDEKRPSIATLLADPAEVKRKRHSFEKMGGVSDRPKLAVAESV
jgi:hypothetical protein